jgi:hypothetical protein
VAAFGFGQSPGQIVQTAYVVQDIKAAIEWWVEDGKVGPWFLLESFTAPEQRYRGRPNKADVSIAMAFAGHMMIELIQPRDEHRSVYKETIDERGYGFHHLGIAVTDVEAERAAYERRGHQVVFSAPVPSGGTVYYLGGGSCAPGMIELIPATPGMDEMFTSYWKASVGWKGENPIRPFALVQRM